MKFILTLSSVFFLANIVFAQDVVWETNIDKAKEQAVLEEKQILMSFSGSDWCASCKRLDKDLFSQEAFLKYANENFILLQVDFPSKKANILSEGQMSHNEDLAARYNKNGAFPSVYVLTEEARIVGKMSHPETSIEAYLESLQSFEK